MAVGKGGLSVRKTRSKIPTDYMDPFTTCNETP
jgi:hypothetical protein